MAATWALYGATTRTSWSVIGRVRPCSSVQVVPLSTRPSTSDATAAASSGFSLSAPTVGRAIDPRAGTAGHERVRCHATAWTAEVRLGLEPVVVEDLGRVVAQVGVEAPRRREEEAALGRHGGVVAEHVGEGRPVGARADGVPCSGWSSCCGSPSRTMFDADPAIATTLASEICPASSTNRTSSASRSPSVAQTHAVPATRFGRRPRCRPRSAVVVAWATRGSSTRASSLVRPLEGADIGPPRRRVGRLQDLAQQVGDDLVARAR